MNKYILSAIGLLATAAAWAQNPIQTTFSVTLKTEQGNDTTIEINSVESNTFSFIGGKGMVTNPYTGETQQVENQDLFGSTAGLDYDKATIQTFLSETVLAQFDGWSDFGYCISKQPAPTVSEQVLYSEKSRYDYSGYAYQGYRPYIVTFDMQDLLDDTCSYTLLFNQYSDLFFPELLNLEYMTTYYVRPFVRLQGNIMYGDEQVVTTPRTVEAALLNEPDIAGWQYYDAETGVVLTPEALQTLWSSSEEPDSALKAGVVDDLGRYLSSEQLQQMKATAYQTIECTDGTLYLVKDVPADMPADFMAYFNSGVSFPPSTLNLTAYQGTSANRLLTTNVATTVWDEATGTYIEKEFLPTACDPAWGVPYNSYFSFTPDRATANPNHAFDIPKYMQAKAYDLYVTLVIPDMENDLRPYSFRAFVYEQTPDGTYNSGTRLMNPKDGSYNFVSDSVRCDTVYLGTFTFNGNPGSIIQLVSYVSMSRSKIYNREMHIAQFTIVPAKEEENE